MNNIDNNNILFEETKKRLQSIYEYTIMPYNGNIEEADDDAENNGNNDQQPPMDGPQDGGMPQDGQQPPMGGDQQGGMPPMGGEQQGGMPPMGGDPMQGGNGPEGFNPQGADPMQGGGDISNADFEGGEDTPSGDDDVVDVTELTDSQKETEKDIEQMDKKFAMLMKQLGSFEELIRQNDEKIENLKTEFEKRNPTQIEKMSLHSNKGYPFNLSVDDYWKEKEATSNYSPDNDNNGKGQGQYVITKNDVNGAVDWKSIADSLDDDDFIYNQTLDGILKY